MLYRPTEISPTDAPNPNLFKATPKSKTQHGIPDIRCPILTDVPVEILTGITSHLAPPDLLSLARVNAHLNRHVNDDNTWRRAFVQQFFGIGPEGDLDDEKTLLLRRSERSWRYELISHHRLIRRWERSRNVTTTHTPVHSVISSMQLMPNDTLLTSSITYGIVARSIPLTGRVLPGFLDATGSRVGLGIGNPNAEFMPNVSACAMSSDGGTAKIVWGSRAGDIFVMHAPRSMETARRSAAQVKRCSAAELHAGPVLDVQWADSAGSWILSGSADGGVKLWDAKTVVCAWSSGNVVDANVPVPCLKVSASISQGVIAAVFLNGDVYIWSGFNFERAPISTASVRETVIECPVQTSSAEVGAPEAQSLFVDPTQAWPTVIVAYLGDAFFYRIRVNPQTPSAPELTRFGDPSFGALSVVVPMFGSANQQGSQSSFALAGDHIGCVSLYALDVDTPASFDPVAPLRKFEAHRDGATVTAITWNGLTLITGSIRGTTHVFDALSFAPLRSFPSPVPRLRAHMAHHGIDPVSRESVHSILVNPEKDVMFVGVGDRVMAWRAGPVPKNVAGGVRGRPSSSSLKKRTPNAKYMEKLELKETILESRDLLKDESTRLRKAFGQERAHRQGLDTLGLSEAEAVEYVLMLSRDEANAQRQNYNGASSSSWVDDDGVFEADFDDDDVGELNDDVTIGSRASSPGSRRPSTSASTSAFSAPPMSSASSTSSSSSASSAARSSRSGMTMGPHGRLVPRASPSSSNDKVQVSMPYRSEPMEAGEEYDPSTSPSPVGMGTRLHLEDHYFPPISAGSSPTASASGSSSALPAAVVTTPPRTSAWKLPQESQVPGPKPVPASISPKSLAGSAWATPLKKKSAAVLVSSSTSSSANASPSRSASASTSASPSAVSAVVARSASAWPGPSRLSTSPTTSTSIGAGVGPRAAPLDGMDDDLRFALELSLAEARSRGEQV